MGCSIFVVRSIRVLDRADASMRCERRAMERQNAKCEPGGTAWGELQRSNMRLSRLRRERKVRSVCYHPVQATFRGWKRQLVSAQVGMNAANGIRRTVTGYCDRERSKKKSLNKVHMIR
mmetsp:Transcript_3335/g.20819  ORF Transcript_3335/g.20819 Transcript_3335/m.20819 type:complete len:119 (+) Transcript_3335:2092-2448(+)